MQPLDVIQILFWWLAAGLLWAAWVAVVEEADAKYRIEQWGANRRTKRWQK